MADLITQPLAAIMLPPVLRTDDPRLVQFAAMSGEPAPGPTNGLTDADGNNLTDADGNYLIWSA